MQFHEIDQQIRNSRNPETVHVHAGASNMVGKSEMVRLAEAVGASLGGLAAFFDGRDARARDHRRDSDFVLGISANSVEVRLRALPDSLPTVQQLGQVLLPICHLEHPTAPRVQVIRHGDSTLETQLPVEAVLYVDATAQKDRIHSSMRVASIATVAADDLHPGGAIVRCPLPGAFCGAADAPPAPDAPERLRDVLVGHLLLFAAVHGAARRAPLRFDYDVFGRQGRIETDESRCESERGRERDPSGSGSPTSSGTSGFSIRVGGRTYAAAAALWADARTDDSPETELVCFDAAGLLPESIARKAISKSGWKRRGGLACRTRKGPGASAGSLVIQNNNVRVARVALYLYPDSFGASPSVANVKDGPESLARSAINTAISSLHGVLHLGTAEGVLRPVGEPPVDEAIVQVAACLRRIRARATDVVHGIDGIDGMWDDERDEPDFSFPIAKTLRAMLLAPSQHM